MKKYYAVFGIVLCLIMGFNLKAKYESFVFHAYETAYYKGIYEGSNEHIQVSSLVFIQQGNESQAGYGYVRYTDLNLENLEIDLMVDDMKYPLNYQIVEEGLIKLDMVTTLNHGDLSLRFIDPQTMESEVIVLHNSQYETLQCHVKEYSITDFFIDENTVVFGYLNAQDSSIVEKYPNITIEYDYIDNDHAIAFYAVNGATADYVNSSKTIIDQVEASIQDKQINVIVSLSNDEDESFTFELELSKVGDQ